MTMDLVMLAVYALLACILFGLSWAWNPRLVTLVCSGVFLYVVGMRLRAPHIFIMAKFLLFLPIVSVAWAYIQRRKIRVTQDLPSSSTEGESITARLRVTGPAGIAAGGLVLERDPVPYVRVDSGAGTAGITPDGSLHELRARIKRRGLYETIGISATRRDPLGVFSFSTKFVSSPPMVVYPAGLPEMERAFLSSGSGGWLMSADSGLRGDDSGFYGIREYQPDDGVRGIHWRTSARRGELVTIMRERALAGRLWIALDTRGECDGMDDYEPTLFDVLVLRWITKRLEPVWNRDRSTLYPERFQAMDRCVRLAVSIMDAAWMRGDAVGLILPGIEGMPLLPQSGPTHRLEILDALARVEADTETTLDSELMKTAFSPGDTVVAVTSAPTRELREALVNLRHRLVHSVGAVVQPHAKADKPEYETVQPDVFVRELVSDGVEAIYLPTHSALVEGVDAAEMVPAGSAL
ncbi:MAG: DUF58 domain-containing protein [Armatimonadetes bacterium]|nr:DUF58 domain-containing protein [Armatimonadota bacterium]